MQVSLKQHEIEAALKGYISAQGINLQGKTVTISFTAGRKESGISADLVIDEAGIPDFGDEAEVEQQEDAPVAMTQPEEVDAALAEDANQEVKTSSLFG